MGLVYYQDEYFYYFWKGHGIPSTFGNKKCFLDNFEIVLESSNGFDKELGNIVKSLANEFGKDNEYGLVNRLDNDTAGLLYFAKNKNIFDDFKKLQKQGLISKYYIADVLGEFRYNVLEVDKVICHHRHVKEKMVIYRGKQDIDKVRGIRHKVSTYLDKLYYDIDKGSSCLGIIIQKGVRHQIRAHLASIGYPIIGENLYTKSPSVKDDFLHLWCVGMEIRANDFR